MTKKPIYRDILIISSDVTGHGHKSITDSLVEQFNECTRINIKVVDGYSLSGSLGLRIGKMYGSITRTSKEAWKHIWDITVKKPLMLIEFIELSIHERFIRLLQEFQPDAIIVTHPNYNTSVTNILIAGDFQIPLFAVVADPVSISPLWCNAAATWTICPTEEARDACLAAGVPDERIRVLGFPVRQRFIKHLSHSKENEDAIDIESWLPQSPMKFIVMSGGEGSGNMSHLSKILLDNFDCNVQILCGRNKVLQKTLTRTITEKYNERVSILGFTENVQKIMLEADILFTRASPNTIMEAVMCNLPVVITGALPGQEEGNPGFVEKHGLGVICQEPLQLKKTVAELMADRFKKLKEIKKSQVLYRTPAAAYDIVQFITHN